MDGLRCQSRDLSRKLVTPCSTQRKSRSPPRTDEAAQADKSRTFTRQKMTDPIAGKYPPNRDEIARQMQIKGLSIEALARKAIVSTKTLHRMLDPVDDKGHHLRTFEKLARAFKLDDVRQLILGYIPDPPCDDPPSDDPNRDTIGMNIDKDFWSTDETEIAEQLAVILKKFLGGKQKIFIISISPANSIDVELNLDDEVIVRVVRGFALGDFLPAGVTSLTLNPKHFVDDPDFNLSHNEETMHNTIRRRMEEGRPLFTEDERGHLQEDDNLLPSPPPLQLALLSLPVVVTHVHGKLVVRRQASISPSQISLTTS